MSASCKKSKKVYKSTYSKQKVESEDLYHPYENVAVYFATVIKHHFRKYFQPPGLLHLDLRSKQIRIKK